MLSLIYYNCYLIVQYDFLFNINKLNTYLTQNSEILEPNYKYYIKDDQ